jgi:hypothetical protein
MTLQPGTPSITIRLADADDEAALRALAQRDSRRVPAGPLVIAIAGSEVRAAVSVLDGAAVADPFHPTAQLVSLLEFRARQLRDGETGHASIWLRSLRRLVPRAA